MPPDRPGAHPLGGSGRADRTCLPYPPLDGEGPIHGASARHHRKPAAPSPPRAGEHDPAQPGHLWFRLERLALLCMEWGPGHREWQGHHLHRRVGAGLHPGPDAADDRRHPLARLAGGDGPWRRGDRRRPDPALSGGVPTRLRGLARGAETARCGPRHPLRIALRLRRLPEGTQGGLRAATPGGGVVPACDHRHRHRQRLRADRRPLRQRAAPGGRFTQGRGLPPSARSSSTSQGCSSAAP